HAPGRGPEGIRNLESKTGQNRLLTPPAVARNLPDAPPCNTAPLPRRPLPCFRYIRTLPRPEHCRNGHNKERKPLPRQPHKAAAAASTGYSINGILQMDCNPKTPSHTPASSTDT